MTTRLRWFIRWMCGALAIVFVGIQFVRPPRTNPAVDSAQTLEAQVDVPAATVAVLDRGCMNCHSDRTQWPWYSSVAPVSWFVIDHVNHARSHLNFSRWAQYDAAERAQRLDGVCKLTREGTMPIASYTWIHRGARLSEDDVRLLCEWSRIARSHALSPQSSVLSTTHPSCSQRPASA